MQSLVFASVTCVVLSWVGLTASAYAAPENLLKNGSFEEGPKVDKKDGYKALDKGSMEIKSWTVIKGQIDYVKGDFTAADGEACLDLHGSPGYGGVEQTVKTVKGKKYRVTLSLAATPGSGRQEIAVKAARDTATFEIAGVPKGGKPVWTVKTCEFVAVDDKTTLKIETTEGKKNPKDGPLLDHVSVVEIGK